MMVEVTEATRDQLLSLLPKRISIVILIISIQRDSREGNLFIEKESKFDKKEGIIQKHSTNLQPLSPRNELIMKKTKNQCNRKKIIIKFK